MPCPILDRAQPCQPPGRRLAGPAGTSRSSERRERPTPAARCRTLDRWTEPSSMSIVAVAIAAVSLALAVRADRRAGRAEGRRPPRPARRRARSARPSTSRGARFDLGVRNVGLGVATRVRVWLEDESGRTSPRRVSRAGTHARSRRRARGDRGRSSRTPRFLRLPSPFAVWIAWSDGAGDHDRRPAGADRVDLEFSYAASSVAQAAASRRRAQLAAEIPRALRPHPLPACAHASASRRSSRSSSRSVAVAAHSLRSRSIRSSRTTIDRRSPPCVDGSEGTVTDGQRLFRRCVSDGGAERRPAIEAEQLTVELADEL